MPSLILITYLPFPPNQFSVVKSLFFINPIFYKLWIPDSLQSTFISENYKAALLHPQEEIGSWSNLRLIFPNTHLSQNPGRIIGMNAN